MRFEELDKDFQQIAIDNACDTVRSVYADNDMDISFDEEFNVGLELAKDRTYHIEFDGRYNEYVLMVD